MYDNSARRAIIAALSNDWHSALELNLGILSEDPNDTDALNRGARAYLALGQIEMAVSLSQRVLEIDPLNPIAGKCLSKCEALVLSGDGLLVSNHSQDSNSVFLEVPGRTRIVSLVNLCEPSVLARLNAGEPVTMMPKMHKVAVTTPDEIYIGRLPDDLATRIIYFVKNGNEYDAYIKSISSQELTVFIREIKRSPDFDHIPSFPIRRY